MGFAFGLFDRSLVLLDDHFALRINVVNSITFMRAFIGGIVNCSTKPMNFVY